MQHAPKLYLAPGDGAGYMDHHKMNSKDKHRHNVLPWAPGAASRMGLCSNPPECKTNATVYSYLGAQLTINCDHGFVSIFWN